MSGNASLPDDYVGFALVGQVNGHGSLHVVWVNNRVGSRAAAWPPDGITSDETWSTAEPMYTAADLTTHDARIASEAAEKALRDAADKWTQGAWADRLPPRDAPRASLILGTSQRAGDFMRAEADRIADERNAS